MAELHPHVLGEDRHLKIREDGNIIELDYEGLESFHEGDAWWGCTVGFRALQLAAKALSRPELWDRNSLSVISKHPGPGVRDAFEYVTRCVSSNRYHLDQADENAGCNPDMKYEWAITSRESTIEIALGTDFVPASFFAFIDRLGSERERDTDQKDLNQLKVRLCEQLWLAPLTSAFEIKFLKFREKQ